MVRGRDVLVYTSMGGRGRARAGLKQMSLRQLLRGATSQLIVVRPRHNLSMAPRPFFIYLILFPHLVIFITQLKQ